MLPQIACNSPSSVWHNKLWQGGMSINPVGTDSGSAMDGSSGNGLDDWWLVESGKSAKVSSLSVLLIIIFASTQVQAGCLFQI